VEQVQPWSLSWVLSQKNFARVHDNLRHFYIGNFVYKTTCNIKSGCTYHTCLGYPHQCTTNSNISISVMSPKVVGASGASTATVAAMGVFTKRITKPLATSKLAVCTMLALTIYINAPKIGTFLFLSCHPR
jgi:hypothetical protein